MALFRDFEARAAERSIPKYYWRFEASDAMLGSAMRSLVSIVDDDESVRESLPDLLRELGFAVQPFSSAEDFLASDYLDKTDCLILDIAMPGMTGPELQLEMSHRPHQIPIIFITAQSDESERQRLLDRGAVACLHKPFAEAELLQALNSALGSNTSE